MKSDYGTSLLYFYILKALCYFMFHVWEGVYIGMYTQSFIYKHTHICVTQLLRVHCSVKVKYWIKVNCFSSRITLGFSISVSSLVTPEQV